MNMMRERLLMLRRAMYSTGLYGCSELKNQEGIALEVDAITYEIECRLRELSRQIALNLSSLEKEEQREYFKTQITCLT